MSEEIKLTLEEIGNVIKYLNNTDPYSEGWSIKDFTPENIRKANEPPENKQQIKLDIK